MSTPIKIKRVDWETLHAETIEKASEAMAKVLHEKSDLYRTLYGAPSYLRPRIRYTVVLEWRGWKLLEVIEDVALGSEFYRGLPNGKRGLFGKCEEFTTTSGDPGYLYHCIDED